MHIPVFTECFFGMFVQFSFPSPFVFQPVSNNFSSVLNVGWAPLRYFTTTIQNIIKLWFDSNETLVMISHDILMFPDLHIVRIQRCTNSTAPVPARRHYKSALDSPVKVKNKGRACVEVVPKNKSRLSPTATNRQFSYVSRRRVYCCWLRNNVCELIYGVSLLSRPVTATPT